LLVGFATKAAWALCILAYSAGPGTEPILFEGRVDGTIVSARGPPVFGWGRVFEVKDTGKTQVNVTIDILQTYLMIVAAMLKWTYSRKTNYHTDTAHWI